MAGYGTLVTYFIVQKNAHAYIPVLVEGVISSPMVNNMASFFRTYEVLVAWCVPQGWQAMPEQIRRARLTVGFAAAAIIVFPMYVITHRMFGDVMGSNLTIIATILFALTPVALRKTQSIAFAANLALVTLSVLTTYFAVMQGGLVSPSMIPKAVIPVVAQMLAGRRSAIVWLCIELSTVTIIAFLHMQGHVFLQTVPSDWMLFDRFTQMSGIIATLFILFFLSESARRQAFTELNEEKKKTDLLLYNTLPAAIVNRMKRGEGRIAEYFPGVTVLFADLVGFTKLSGERTPAEVVALLDSLFSALDELAVKHKVEKIKTIGDCYMVASGLPEHVPDHCKRIAEFALDMLVAISLLRVRLQAEHIAFRIGIHTGEVVAGVIGSSKLTYDLWGDTVNTASRMESHGEPGRIHVSKEVYEILKNDPRFIFDDRGVIDVKGKGRLRTYFLRPQIT